MSILNKIALPTTIAELEQNVQTTVQYYQTNQPCILEIEPTLATLTEYCTGLNNTINYVKHHGQLPNSKDCNLQFIQSANAVEFAAMVVIIETSIIQALVDNSISQNEYDTEGKEILLKAFTTLMFCTPDMYKPKPDSIVHQSLVDLNDFKFI